MKKLLLVLIALGILLVGCSSTVETTKNPTASTTVNVLSKTIITPETTCQVLQGQLKTLTKEVQQDKTDLAAARGDTEAQSALEVSLLKLHLRIQQVQKSLKGCPVTL